MSRVLILAKSGFGKTFSIGRVPELGHEGLNPKETYIISVTSKPLTFPGSNKDYKIASREDPSSGNRFITKNPEEAAMLLEHLINSPYKNIVIDDANYFMQDYYMDNALKQGWDAPKKIGYFMGKLFSAIEKYDRPDKHIFMLAHGEDVPGQDGRVYTKLKTTGKMVDEYITPEGKFDITLVGKSTFDTSRKIVKKEYITNEDEFVSSPKSPYGMFEDLYIPNDLGVVVDAIDKYYN